MIIFNLLRNLNEKKKIVIYYFKRVRYLYGYTYIEYISHIPLLISTYHTRTFKQLSDKHFYLH